MCSNLLAAGESLFVRGQAGYVVTGACIDTADDRHGVAPNWCVLRSSCRCMGLTLDLAQRP